MKLSLIVLLAFCLFLPGCTLPSCTPLDLGDPADTVEQFVSLMKDGRFAEAEDLLDASVSFGIRDGVKIDEADLLAPGLLAALQESYSVAFSDDSSRISGKQAAVTFRFTSLNVTELAEGMKDMVTEIGQERALDGIVYDEDLAAALAYEVWIGQFDGQTEKLREFYSTRTVVLEARFYGGTGWRLIVTEAFCSALLGI